ncbi:MAG: hypothetical protein ACSHX0_01355 [Akkermansiaceae bacterium]
MKTLSFLTAAICLASLSSCSMIKGILGIPMGVARVISSGVGLNGILLSDQTGEPYDASAATDLEAQAVPTAE